MRLPPRIQKKGAGRRRRAPKAKGIIRYYSKPPSLPSSTSPLCLHTHPNASFCVYADISHFHQFLGHCDSHPYPHPQQNSHWTSRKGFAPFTPFLFAVPSNWPIPSRLSLAPLLPQPSRQPLRLPLFPKPSGLPVSSPILGSPQGERESEVKSIRSPTIQLPFPEKQSQHAPSSPNTGTAQADRKDRYKSI